MNRRLIEARGTFPWFLRRRRCSPLIWGVSGSHSKEKKAGAREDKAKQLPLVRQLPLIFSAVSSPVTLVSIDSAKKIDTATYRRLSSGASPSPSAAGTDVQDPGEDAAASGQTERWNGPSDAVRLA